MKDAGGQTSMRSRQAAVWGDGFADDDWSDMAAVRGWEAVDPDEYVRFFPNLVPQPGHLPDELLDHLSAVLERMAGAGPLPLGRERTVSVLRQIVHDRTVPDAQSLAPASPASFAFATGVHPAYLWPREALAPGRGATAAWLGVIGQGRPALMPTEVADYLVDVVERRDGLPTAVRDPEIGALCGSAGCIERVWQVARDRQRGVGTILRGRQVLEGTSVWGTLRAVASDVLRRITPRGS